MRSRSEWCHFNRASLGVCVSTDLRLSTELMEVGWAWTRVSCLQLSHLTGEYSHLAAQTRLLLKESVLHFIHRLVSVGLGGPATVVLLLIQRR